MAFTRWPEARPWVWAITVPITFPISFMDLAPVLAMAA